MIDSPEACIPTNIRSVPSGASGERRAGEGAQPCSRLNAEAAGVRSALNRTAKNASDGASPHAD
jgi:hypothetical protein